MANTDTADMFVAKAATSAFIVGAHSRISRNGIVFNDRSGIECYWVEDFQGFEAPDLIVGAQANVEEDGELPDPGFFGGRTMTLSGWIQSGSYPHLLDMEQALKASLIELVELPMTISRAPTSPYITHPDMTINCRPIDKPLVDKKLQAGDRSGILKRSFTVAVRASLDPTFKSTVLQTAHLIPIAPAVFGRPYPRTYDIAYTTPVDPSYNPAYHPDIVIVHTDGNYDNKPVIRFTGGLQGITFTNQTNGHVIRINGIIAAGDYVEVDVAAGTVEDSQGNDKSSMFDTTSDWMRLLAKRGSHNGDNTIAVQAQWFDATGSVDIWWRDTYISA